LLPWLNAGAATARQHSVSRDAALIALRAVNLSPVTGFPAIVVPVGFTRRVYDRVPDTSDPKRKPA